MNLLSRMKHMRRVYDNERECVSMKFKHRDCLSASLCALSLPSQDLKSLMCKHRTQKTLKR
jgi:hypothetical protein